MREDSDAQDFMESSDFIVAIERINGYASAKERRRLGDNEKITLCKRRDREDGTSVPTASERAEREGGRRPEVRSERPNPMRERSHAERTPNQAGATRRPLAIVIRGDNPGSTHRLGFVEAVGNGEFLPSQFNGLSPVQPVLRPDEG